MSRKPDPRYTLHLIRMTGQTPDHKEVARNGIVGVTILVTLLVLSFFAV